MKSFSQIYLKLIGISAAVAVALIALGYYPTVRIADETAIAAMIIGVSISFVASCIGSIPIGLAGQGDPTKIPQSIMLATALRFLVVLAFAASVLLAGWFNQVALALWIGLSYMAMLVVDTVFAVRVVGRTQGNNS